MRASAILDCTSSIYLSSMRSSSAEGRRVLVCYSNSSTHTDTTLRYLESFLRYGSASYYYLNVTGDVVPALDLDEFDAVILGYCARLCFSGYVSEKFLVMLERYKGIKAVVIQDEYDYVERERCALDRVSPDVVFTCIPQNQRELIYPSSRYPSTRFVQVLTGYYQPLLNGRSRRPLHERTIDIGYRARSLGIRYGRLARLKYDIGILFSERAKSTRLAVDISLDDSKRLYGNDWLLFLSNCKAVLGSPSGSNIFDFDGSIAEMSGRYESLSPHEQSQLVARIESLDNTYCMNQISPRIFEAASVGAVQVLYRDDYSGVLQPGIHYIPVELDGSNVDSVLDLLSDVSRLQEIADNAYNHLIASGNYGYDKLVALAEASIFPNSLPQRPVLESPIQLEKSFTDTSLDPRIERPTLAPRPFDSYQLRSLLVVLRQERVRRTLYLMYPRFYSLFRALISMVPFGRRVVRRG